MAAGLASAEGTAGEEVDKEKAELELGRVRI